MNGGAAIVNSLGTADPNVSAAQLDCLLPFAFYLAAWMPRRLRAAMWVVAAITFASGIVVALRMTETLRRSPAIPA